MCHAVGVVVLRLRIQVVHLELSRWVVLFQPHLRRTHQVWHQVASVALVWRVGKLAVVWDMVD